MGRAFVTSAILLLLAASHGLAAEYASPNPKPNPATAASPKPAEETAEQRNQRLAWWREARFGMFIHWGPVSLKGTEISWSRGRGRGKIPPEVYDNLYKEFNPSKFDARRWAAIARSAGMKYMVFTTKHHDGFCMFDSKLTDYKITNSPFGRDVTKELAEACREAKLPLGFYYSPPDFHHPDYRKPTHAKYIEYMHGQLRELSANYGPVAIIWYDGLGGRPKDWDSVRLNAMIRQLQPGVLINDRSGLAEDYSTPEGHLGLFSLTRDWEACLCLCRQWAWKPNDEMKSLEDCIELLARAAGANGNLLLNVGPTATGEIEPRQVQRLEQVGQWLKKSGEAIYGTRGGPYIAGPWGACTNKGNTIYLHVFQWTGTEVKLPALEKKVVKSSLLAGGKVEVTQAADGLTITVPQADRQSIDTVVVLELDGPAAEIKPVATGKFRRRW